MALSWKDAATTILAVGTGSLTYAKYQNWQSWLTGSRWGIIGLGLVGILMCALGAGEPMPSNSPWFIGLSVMGGLALLLVLAGLISTSSLVFYALAADILALWLLATLRHAGA